MDAALGMIHGVLNKYGFVSQPFETQDASGNIVVEFPKFVYGVFYTFLGVFLWVFISAMGAARLSYCYNLNVGNDEGVAFLFAILCFCFPSLYYPYYAFFLNTACSAPSRGMFSGGGKSKRR